MPWGQGDQSFYGVWDSFGNVREWVADEVVPGGAARIVKGAAFSREEQAPMTLAARSVREAGAQHADIGFRCVRDYGGATWRQRSREGARSQGGRLDRYVLGLATEAAPELP